MIYQDAAAFLSMLRRDMAKPLPSLYGLKGNMSQYSQGMFASNNDKPIKLSPRQKEILAYLSQSLSYREISEKTGVKVATINDHIRKIYTKLEVSNTYDAVMKASELGTGL